jgi:hypothetical protein
VPERAVPGGEGRAGQAGLADASLQLLCEFGADTEDALRLLAGLPGLPIVSTATYHHLDCLLLLLLHGASPDLAGHPARPSQALLTPLLHAIVRYK